MRREFTWAVKERDTGIQAAFGRAPTEEEAHDEMMRYALQYGQDGPVSFSLRHGRKTLITGSIGGVTIRVIQNNPPPPAAGE